MTPLYRCTWYVKPRGRRWALQRDGAQNATSLHDRREDAIERGVEVARNNRGRLRVKGQSGRVEAERDFSQVI